jgi:hypothetical protein
MAAQSLTCILASTLVFEPERGKHPPRTSPLDQVVPGLGDSFADRLGSAPSSRERFGLLADALLELAAHGREPDDFG